jgi:Protein of unknown function, DUF547
VSELYALPRVVLARPGASGALHRHVSRRRGRPHGQRGGRGITSVPSPGHEYAVMARLRSLGGAQTASHHVPAALATASGGCREGLPDPFGIARSFVEEARVGRDTAAARAALAGLDPAALAAALPDDAARIAFWLNIYNGAVRARLLADPEAYRRRWLFYAMPAVTVAGRRLSPNAIENGLLRRSAFLAGLGYLRNPLPSLFERLLRVGRVDPRIHFALNCGARSCPPFAVWESTTLDADLERATGAYLAAESARSAAGTVLTVPRLLSWYRGDFGGRAGTLALLRRHGLIGPDETPRLRYGDYDWRLDLADAARG